MVALAWQRRLGKRPACSRTSLHLQISNPLPIGSRLDLLGNSWGALLGESALFAQRRKNILLFKF